MFTGLVETTGILAGMTRMGKSAELLVRCGLPVAELVRGESIAVNGVRAAGRADCRSMR